MRKWVKRGAKRQEKEKKRQERKETREKRYKKRQETKLFLTGTFKGRICGIADGGNATGNLWHQRKAAAKAETNIKDRPDYQRAFAWSQILHH